MMIRGAMKAKLCFVVALTHLRHRKMYFKIVNPVLKPVLKTYLNIVNPLPLVDM